MTRVGRRSGLVEELLAEAVLGLRERAVGVAIDREEEGLEHGPERRAAVAGVEGAVRLGEHDGRRGVGALEVGGVELAADEELDSRAQVGRGLDRRVALDGAGVRADELGRVDGRARLR